MEFIIDGVTSIGQWMLDGLKEVILGLLKWILLGIIDNSYWICLMICMMALFLYVGGLKRAGKWVGGSFTVYFLLQALGLAMK